MLFQTLTTFYKATMFKEVIKSTLDALAFSQVVRKEGFISEGILLNLTETVITDH